MNWFPISAALLALCGTMIYPWAGWTRWLHRSFGGRSSAPNPELAALAEEMAQRRPDLKVKPGVMPVVDEVQTLRRLGYRAICLAGRDSQTDSLPRWHTCEDTLEHVSAVALGRAAEFVWEMLQEIDRQCRKGACNATRV